jgi:hypothetical protein
MGKYSGTIDELKSVVQNFGLSGSWAETPNSAYKFTSSDGGILTWFPSTKTLLIQGKPGAKKTIEGLIEHIEKGEIPTNSISLLKEISISPTVFVVYGHDDQSREQLDLF